MISSLSVHACSGFCLVGKGIVIPIGLFLAMLQVMHEKICKVSFYIQQNV